MNIKPLHDWAVIRPTGAEEMTAGGLYIPDSAKEKPQEGVVVLIGPGALEEDKDRYAKKKDEKKERRFIPTTIKPGDLVLYEQYAGQTYTLSGEDLVLIRERDILGTLLERTPRPVVAARPLLIPAHTYGSGTTALVKSSGSAVPKRAVKKAAKKKAEKKKAKKAAKKVIKKATKKAAKRTAAKPAKKSVKKAAAKKIVKPAKKKTVIRKAAAKKTKKKK